jgi:hypothetical protein
MVSIFVIILPSPMGKNPPGALRRDWCYSIARWIVYVPLTGDYVRVMGRKSMVLSREVSRCAFMVTASLAVVFLLAGCGGKEDGTAGGSDGRGLAGDRPLGEEAIEADAGSKVDVVQSGESVRIRGRGDRKDYSFAGGGKIKVPDGFPADVSIYPGAKIQMAQEQLRSDLTAIFSTMDERDAVLDFYRADAAANGWHPMSEAVLEDEIFLGFAKEGKALTVAADPDDKRTFISISYKVKEF